MLEARIWIEMNLIWTRIGNDFDNVGFDGVGPGNDELDSEDSEPTVLMTLFFLLNIEKSIVPGG